MAETQFADSFNKYPVSANVTAEGWQSNGIGFDDYKRMNTRQHKLSGERRLPTPEWALNPEKLRKLIVRMMERRADLVYAQPGTDAERLARAQARIAQKIPSMEAFLDRLCQEYVEKQSDPTATEWRKKQRILIEGADSEIRTMHKPDRGAALLASIVHHYYGACLDSVGVGLELGIKPPVVRQTLWRMHRVWEKMKKAEAEAPVDLALCEHCGFYTGKGHLHACGKFVKKFCVVCGNEVPAHHRKFCGKKCYNEKQKQKKREAAAAQFKPAFCSAECKGRYGTPAVAIAQPFDAAKVELDGGDSYDSYLEYCQRLDVAPMIFSEWATRKENL